MGKVTKKSYATTYTLEIDEDEAIVIAALLGKVSAYDSDREHTHSLFAELQSQVPYDKYRKVCSRIRLGSGFAGEGTIRFS